jgi:hypothetical protein
MGKNMATGRIQGQRTRGTAPAAPIMKIAK